MAGRRMPYIPVTDPRSVKIHARYGICMHYPSQRINVPCQAIDRQGHRPDYGTGQRRCHVNRYGFSIRTRHGQRVDNILIMAATQVDAERRLRQMYHHCQITECETRGVAPRLEALDVDSVIGLISASPSSHKAGTQ